ncbi:lipid-transfer protein, partial [Frankia sp. CNm7]|nr:lipid-transfer protein [Frankia nepalensis]
MTRSPHHQAAIVGIGQTEFSKRSGRSELQLAVAAARAARDAAGLRPAAGDGRVTVDIAAHAETAGVR